MDKLIDLIIDNAGFIITAITFFIPPVRDFVIKKFKFSLDKAMEDKKSINERKNYISKVKFNTEFKIYRKLSKAFFDMVKGISIMIPSGIVYLPEDPETKKQYDYNNYKKALTTTTKAQNILNENSPFISEELYNEYSKILSLCRQQLGVFEDMLYQKESLSINDYKRTETINKNMETLNNKIRKYISTLDVIE